MPDAPQTTPLLTVDDLVVDYPGSGFRARGHRALHGVNLAVSAHETFGIVGESGSGKSTIGKVVLGLATATSGRVSFDGTDLATLNPAGRRRLAPEIQAVFQDPLSSLNPALSIEDILTEPLTTNGVSRTDARRRVGALLDTVGLPAGSAQRFASEFSGGQRQRIAIARALALQPRLIICDEPVSALDLSTQVRVLDLLVDIQRETGVAYLFITHDLDVVRYISHRVAVLRGGRIVETGETDAVTLDPQHPYTRRLMLASPATDPAVQAERRRLRHAAAADALVLN